MDDPLIMLIEDSPDDVALTMRALRKSDIKARVELARDGVEALDYFFESGNNGAGPELPDLVILDLKLPKLDGIEVLQRLRTHELTQYLPIVVLTTSNEERDRARCYRLGANSFIRKPVDYTRFSEVMRQICGYWLQLNEAMPQKAATR